MTYILKFQFKIKKEAKQWHDSINTNFKPCRVELKGNKKLKLKRDNFDLDLSFDLWEVD